MQAVPSGSATPVNFIWIVYSLECSMYHTKCDSKLKWDMIMKINCCFVQPTQNPTLILNYHGQWTLWKFSWDKLFLRYLVIAIWLEENPPKNEAIKRGVPSQPYQVVPPSLHKFLWILYSLYVPCYSIYHTKFDNKSKVLLCWASIKVISCINLI